MIAAVAEGSASSFTVIGGVYSSSSTMIGAAYDPATGVAYDPATATRAIHPAAALQEIVLVFVVHQLSMLLLLLLLLLLLRLLFRRWGRS
jgi:hypothetical protein